MNIKKNSEKNRTLVFDVSVPKKDVEKRYKDALTKLAKKAKVEGFREGKAPTELAEKSIGKEKIYDQLIQDLLPDVYEAIVKEHDVKPVIAPKVDLKDAKEDEDWTLTMSFALRPTIKLPDYKKIVKKEKVEVKKDDIWVPGKGDPTKLEAKDMQKREEFLNKILKAIIDSSEIELSEIIIEQEINQRLSRLVADLQKLGLTLEAYLQSQKLTQEKLKESFMSDIMNTYKLEYALTEIGDKEGITVEKDELEKLIGQVPEGKDKAEVEQNAYVYSTMLRKQKILDFLGNL